MSQHPALERLVSPLRALIERLVKEHRTFADQNESLTRMVTEEDEATPELTQLFYTLRDGLLEHIHVEEAQIYPDLKEHGQFDSLVEMIMQQHEELKEALQLMEEALNAKDIESMWEALILLTDILGVHQPAEEEVVFPMIE